MFLNSDFPPELAVHKQIFIHVAHRVRSRVLAFIILAHLHIDMVILLQPSAFSIKLRDVKICIQINLPTNHKTVRHDRPQRTLDSNKWNYLPTFYKKIYFFYLEGIHLSLTNKFRHTEHRTH